MIQAQQVQYVGVGDGQKLEQLLVAAGLVQTEMAQREGMARSQRLENDSDRWKGNPQKGLEPKTMVQCRLRRWDHPQLAAVQTAMKSIIDRIGL